MSTKLVRESGEMRAGWTRTCQGLLCLLVMLGAWLAPAGVAHAADAWQFQPEVSAFVPMNARTRIYLDAAFAKEKESDVASPDLAAYVDVSLKPIARARLLTEDWQRSRYLWVRIGYDRIFSATDTTGVEVAEDRGIVSLYWKVSLPAEVWLETRARADLRWIGGEYSTRGRFRVEATREFTVLKHTVVPYCNAEWFYDTRYDGWARTLYQLGPEVTVNDHFRYEVYLSRQVDRLPERKDINAVGVVLKWYY